MPHTLLGLRVFAIVPDNTSLTLGSFGVSDKIGAA